MRRVLAGVILALLAAPVLAQTPTPTLPEEHFSCIDLDADARCGFGLYGSERSAEVLPGLQWQLTGADPICDLTSTGQTSPQSLAKLLDGDGSCTDGGTVVRGSDGFLELRALDVLAYHDFAKTLDQPRDGICYGEHPQTGCRLEIEGGFVGSWPTNAHGKCIGGPSYKTPCVPAGFGTPTPCPGSECKPWIFGNGEAGVVVNGCPAGMCGQRSRPAWTMENVDAFAREARARGVVPLLIIWRLPAPTDPTWEELAYLRALVHAYEKKRRDTPEEVHIVDLESWAQIETAGNPLSWDLAARGPVAINACVSGQATFLHPEYELGNLPRQRCAGLRRPAEFQTWDPPTETPTPTRTATASSTPTNPPATATATWTRTQTAAPSDTPLGGVPTATVTYTPGGETPIPPTVSPECSNPAGVLTTARVNACDQYGVAMFRRLKDKAAWIFSRGLGYRVGACQMGTLDSSKCAIEFNYGASRFNNVLAHQGTLPFPSFDNEPLCNNPAPTTDSSCGQDMAGNTDHNAKSGKFDSGSCRQYDHVQLWRWFGNPDARRCGYCSLDGRVSVSVTPNSCPCRSIAGGPSGNVNCNASTSAYEMTCPSGAGLPIYKVDTVRFGKKPADPSLPVADPDPPNARPRPKAREIYMWEIDNALVQNFAEPIDDYALGVLRGVTPTITDECAETILDRIFDEMSEEYVSSGCLGTCSGKADRFCTKAADCQLGGDFGTCTIAAACITQGYNACMDMYAQGTVRSRCGTCDNLEGGTSGDPFSRCPATPSCPGAQITCETWSALCDEINRLADPIRYGCRQRARPGYE